MINRTLAPRTKFSFDTLARPSVTGRSVRGPTLFGAECEGCVSAYPPRAFSRTVRIRPRIVLVVFPCRFDITAYTRLRVVSTAHSVRRTLSDNSIDAVVATARVPGSVRFDVRRGRYLLFVFRARQGEKHRSPDDSNPSSLVCTTVRLFLTDIYIIYIYLYERFRAGGFDPFRTRTHAATSRYGVTVKSKFSPCTATSWDRVHASYRSTCSLNFACVRSRHEFDTDGYDYGKISITITFL